MKDLHSWSVEIVRQNRTCGHNATRFQGMVAGKSESEIRGIWSGLLRSEKAYAELFEAVLRSPGMLTVEAVVAEFGAELAFSVEDIDAASQRVRELAERDRSLAPARRYA